MEKDFSRLLYDKYFGLSNRNIKIKLKNGTVFNCTIIGFFKTGDESDTPYISGWHISSAGDKSTLGINPPGLLNGQVIAQNEIAEVCFLEDNSILKFL